jgi:hypothetical protein
MGKDVGYIPNKASYRIEPQHLRDGRIADRLHKICLAYASIDPREQSAEATRDVALWCCRNPNPSIATGKA